MSDQLSDYILGAKMPREAWGNLKKIFAASMMVRKLQLKHELNNIGQRDMLVTDYTSRIKEIYNVLGSINVMVDEDEILHVDLGVLA